MATTSARDLAELVEKVKSLELRGISGIALFPTADKVSSGGGHHSSGPGEQDRRLGGHLLDPSHPFHQALRILRSECPTLSITVDACVCCFSPQGHCVLDDANGAADVEGTVEFIAEFGALVASEGATAVMVSSTVPGAISSLRSVLLSAGRSKCNVWSESAKFASALYGAFRGLSGVSEPLLDKSAYQYAVSDRAAVVSRLREDGMSGAAVLVVKPTLGYLDVIADLKAHCTSSICAFVTTGESMLLEGTSRSLEDRVHLVRSVLGSISRAGADFALSRDFADIDVLTVLVSSANILPAA